MQARSLLILCDLGQVLAYFDRRLLAENFARWSGRPFPPEAETRSEELRIPFESGQIDSAGFLLAMREFLGWMDGEQEQIFRRAWGSILWPNEECIQVFRAFIQRPRVWLHVVTNTDPWRLEYARTELSMADLLSHCTASFEPEVEPKGKSSQMWRLARARGLRELAQHPSCVVGIDDLAENLQPAVADGTLDWGIHFQNAKQLECELQHILQKEGLSDLG